MFWRKNWIFRWSISLYAFSSSFCASAKLESLSLHNTLMFPLRTTNRRRACQKESVSRLQVHSIWTALLDMHINSVPYFLSYFLPSFPRKGPSISTPQFVKGVHQLVYLPSFSPQASLAAIDIWHICLVSS